MIKYSLIELENTFVTQGLNSRFGKEFSIKKGSYDDTDIRLIIDYILSYSISSKREIKDKETFGCGSWLLQFIINDTYVSIYELKSLDDKGNNVYDFDLSITITLYKSQFELCSSLNLTPQIPRLNQKIAISEEIYSGSEVNAVRYNAPEHMSGWYLTSNNFNGDLKSLSVDYLFYLIQTRPELAKFLALPSGYRFFTDEQGFNVWKDEEV